MTRSPDNQKAKVKVYCRIDPELKEWGLRNGSNFSRSLEQKLREEKEMAVFVFDGSKTITVNFGGNQKFCLTNIHSNRSWSAKEGFHEGLMNCEKIFAIPENKNWRLVNGSRILKNGSLEIEIQIRLGDIKDSNCLTENRKCCILPQFVSIQDS